MTDPTPLTDDELVSMDSRGRELAILSRIDRSRPYTDDELAAWRERYEPRGGAVNGQVVRRLAATVDHWREAHNQVAAQLEHAETERTAHIRMHVDAIVRWQDTCDAVLNAVIEHGTLASVVGVVADWLDGSDALNDEVCDRIRQAHDKAVVGYVSGTPGEDTAPADTHTRTSTGGHGPDFCAECSEAVKEWVQWPCRSACPDCRPVGDPPGDTGNQP